MIIYIIYIYYIGTIHTLHTLHTHIFRWLNHVDIIDISPRQEDPLASNMAAEEPPAVEASKAFVIS